MKKIVLSILALAAFAFAGQGFVLLESAKTGKDIVKAVNDGITKSGFVIADEKDLNVAFAKQFESSSFEMYHNITVFDAKTLGTEVAKNPRLAGFVPYTVLIYQKKGEKKSHIGFVGAAAITLATGINDKNVAKLLKKSEQRLEKELKLAIGDAKATKLPYSVAPKADKELFFDAAVKLKANDNALSKKEDLQKEFESTLEVEGFKISNITDIKSELEKVKVDVSNFEFFETYSICKLKVIYNASQERPEAGVFAPCSVFFYKLKGDNAIHVGFPPTKNWVVQTNITSAEHIKIMQEAENVAKNFFKDAAE